jgi:hypothetical protein
LNRSSTKCIIKSSLFGIVYLILVDFLTMGAFLSSLFDATFLTTPFVDVFLLGFPTGETDLA